MARAKKRGPGQGSDSRRSSGKQAGAGAGDKADSRWRPEGATADQTGRGSPGASSGQGSRPSGASETAKKAVSGAWGRLSGARAVTGKGSQPSSPHGPVSHVKVALATVSWIALIREQAFLMADWRLYYYQALVASAGLLVCTLVAVYLYRPRTARWRTITWTFLVSSAGGLLVYTVFGGRAGLLGSLITGGLVIWARGAERGRRTIRRFRAWRRRAGTPGPRPGRGDRDRE